MFVNLDYWSPPRTMFEKYKNTQFRGKNISLVFYMKRTKRSRHGIKKNKKTDTNLSIGE